MCMCVLHDMLFLSIIILQYYVITSSQLNRLVYIIEYVCMYVCMYIRVCICIIISCLCTHVLTCVYIYISSGENQWLAIKDL